MEMNSADREKLEIITRFAKQAANQSRKSKDLGIPKYVRVQLESLIKATERENCGRFAIVGGQGINIKKGDDIDKLAKIWKQKKGIE